MKNGGLHAGIKRSSDEAIFEQKARVPFALSSLLVDVIQDIISRCNSGYK